MLANETMKTC